MRRFVLLFILLPLAVVMVILSVANRGDVTLSLDPFSATAPLVSLTAPLFVILFAVLILGVLIGGIATWLRQSKWRRMARQERAKADRLARDVERLSKQAAAGPALPAPPSQRNAA